MKILFRTLLRAGRTCCSQKCYQSCLAWGPAVLLLIILWFFFSERGQSQVLVRDHFPCLWDEHRVLHLILRFPSLLFAAQMHYQQNRLIFHEDSVVSCDLFAIHLNLCVCQIPSTLNPSLSWASKWVFYAKSLSNASQQDRPEGMSQFSAQHAALIFVSVQGLQMRTARADFHANGKSYVIKDQKKKKLDTAPLLSPLICADKLQILWNCADSAAWTPLSSLLVQNTGTWNRTGEAQLCSISTPQIEHPLRGVGWVGMNKSKKLQLLLKKSLQVSRNRNQRSLLWFWSERETYWSCTSGCSVPSVVFSPWTLRLLSWIQLLFVFFFSEILFCLRANPSCELQTCLQLIFHGYPSFCKFCNTFSLGYQHLWN